MHNRLQVGLMLVALILTMWLAYRSASQNYSELTFTCRICGGKRGEIRHKLNDFTIWTIKKPYFPNSIYERIFGKPHQHEWAGGPAYHFHALGHGDGHHGGDGYSLDQNIYTQQSLLWLNEIPFADTEEAWRFHMLVVECEKHGGFQQFINAAYKRPQSISEFLALIEQGRMDKQ
ncbi:hypothetical protein ESB00_09615 [Oleiharenicola lentus]|uniref:Uncharacterized protein n=1 Tax=Oleiharenicola lentus TaxID=2508720 RepID=A0A4Q1CAX7_9BACT|nr:hypothetical protein [Oleiharenicola lentus]RXK56108.1 hypothetical protein ESB00_09615 [Oleiharenicola lentus]